MKRKKIDVHEIEIEDLVEMDSEARAEYVQPRLSPEETARLQAEQVMLVPRGGSKRRVPADYPPGDYRHSLTMEELTSENPLTPGRDHRGMFAKGHKLGERANVVRHTKAVKNSPLSISDFQQAMADGIPPDEIINALKEIILDTSPRNRKHQLEAIRIVLDRLWGKPVAATVTASLDMEQFSRMFLDTDAPGRDGPQPDYMGSLMDDSPVVELDEGDYYEIAEDGEDD